MLSGLLTLGLVTGYPENLYVTGDICLATRVEMGFLSVFAVLSGCLWCASRPCLTLTQ